MNTPFILVHIELKQLISGNLYKKYKKTRQYLEQRKKDNENKKEESGISEELEFFRKMAEENHRLLKGTQKIYSEEDFLLNYNDHYPDLIKEEVVTENQSLITRMNKQSDIQAFRKKEPAKPKKKVSEEVKEENEDDDKIIIIKKVKKKKKRFKP